MASGKNVNKNPQSPVMSRREAAKLAAAAAAFGSVLGFRASAEGAGRAQRETLKIDKMTLKFYRKDILLYSFSFPLNLSQEIMNGNKILLKFYRNENWIESDLPLSFS